jgi:hypothetical protein
VGTTPRLWMHSRWGLQLTVAPAVATPMRVTFIAVATWLAWRCMCGKAKKVRGLVFMQTCHQQISTKAHLGTTMMLCQCGVPCCKPCQNVFPSCAFPRHSINHVSTHVCSLFTQTLGMYTQLDITHWELLKGHIRGCTGRMPGQVC